MSKSLNGRFRSLRTPSNLLLISLSLSGLLMMGKVPVFMINLYHGGPFTGVVGSQVKNKSSKIYLPVVD